MRMLTIPIIRWTLLLLTVFMRSMLVYGSDASIVVGRKIPPPPPPRMTMMSRASSTSSTSPSSSSLFSEEIIVPSKRNVSPPPPPPRPKENLDDTTTTSKIHDDRSSVTAETSSSGRIPPPPPPQTPPLQSLKQQQSSTPSRQWKLPPPPPPLVERLSPVVAITKPQQPHEMRTDAGASDYDKHCIEDDSKKEQFAPKSSSAVGDDNCFIIHEQLQQQDGEDTTIGSWESPSIEKNHDSEIMTVSNENHNEVVVEEKNTLDDVDSLIEKEKDRVNDTTVEKDCRLHQPSQKPVEQYQYQWTQNDFTQPPPKTFDTNSGDLSRSASHYQTNHPPPPPPPPRHQPSRSQRYYPSTLQPPRVTQPRSTQAAAALSSSSKSVFQHLWGKVERGLDELASLENTVMDRAQRFVSTVTPQVKTSTSASQHQRSSSTRAQSAVASPTYTKVALKPYGQKYQIAKEENSKRQLNESNKQQQKPKKTSDWNSFVLSSGGATAPHDHSNDDGDDTKRTVLMGTSTTSPPITMQSTGTPRTMPPPMGAYGQNSNAGMATTSTSTSSTTSSAQYGGDPRNSIHRPMYDPARSQQASATAADIERRTSRIPWDTSSSPLGQQQAPGGRPVQPASLRPSYADDDDDDTPGWKQALQKLVPPVPRIGKLFRFRNKDDKYQYASMDAWKTDEEEEDSGGGGFFGLFRGKKSTHRSSASMSSSSPSSYGSDSDKTEGVPRPIVCMLDRCDGGKTTSLLHESDKRAIRFIGRYLATLDVTFLVLIMLGVQQMSGFDQLLPLPGSLDDFIAVTIPKFGSILNDTMMGTWAFFAFLYAYLSSYARGALLERRIEKVSSSVATSVKEETEYTQLYLRLVAAIPLDEHLPSRLASVARKQVASLVSKARLDSYVAIVLASLAIMTISVVGPMLTTSFSTIVKIVSLKELRNWPVPWGLVWDRVASLLKTMFLTLESFGAQELKAFLDHPMQFAFHVSMFASLLSCTLLPRLEERRVTVAASTGQDDLEEEAAASNMESAEEWSRLGTSSASRLSMLSENGSVENALERWRASRIPPLEGSNRPSLPTMLRLAGYTMLAALFAAAPLIVSHYLVGETPSLSALPVPRWDSLIDLSFLQVFLFFLVYQALWKVAESTDHLPSVKNFLTELVRTKEEMRESNKRQSDFQVMASVSASAGLTVRDLWAAHTTKRAWAVRGASLQCKNGEILAIIGDDGEGKTRLLTTLAEALMFPPKRSLTTNKVRGYVAVGGLDASKWDRRMLKRRLGVLLSDVRMTADSASLFSGWTMEEILEPVDGLRTNNQIDPLKRKLTASEKSSMLLALKITGLYSTLLSRLPSKLSTIFTANEEDLRPTSLKPRATVLSPGEWSKLILARVLAQTIYDNDNALASNDKIENSLIGSVLLLDDPTIMLSEVEECKFLIDLRQTGAATILTTNKWATGRFADHICVVKDGAIVEMGSHNDLISRGPQQSLYAAKWHAMTMQ